jgi:hypothetical protein
LNPGRRGGKPATNRLSYGAASQDSSCLRPLGYRDLQTKALDAKNFPMTDVKKFLLKADEYE